MTDGGFFPDDFIEHDNVDFLKQCLDSGQISAHSLCPSRYNRDWTLLQGFSRNGCIGCVDLLIKYGANLNCVDDFKRTALAISLLWSYPVCALRLIEARASLEIKDIFDQTPLEMCLDCKRSELGVRDRENMIRILLFAGAKLDNVSELIEVPDWVRALANKIERHQALSLSLYAAQRKERFLPKDVVLVISRMVWEKRKEQ